MQTSPFHALQLTEWWGHYRSVLKNPEDAHKEFERYRAAQIAVDVDNTTLERLLPKGHVNNLGLDCQGVAKCASSSI